MWCLKCHALPREVLQILIFRWFLLFFTLCLGVSNLIPSKTLPLANSTSPASAHSTHQLTQLTRCSQPLPWQSQSGRPGRRARHRLCQWPHPPTEPGRGKITRQNRWKSERYQKWIKTINNYITIYIYILQYLKDASIDCEILQSTVDYLAQRLIRFISAWSVSQPWDHPHGSNVGSGLSSADSPNFSYQTDYKK